MVELRKRSIRQLKQYRNLTDEEFDKIYSELVAGETTVKEFENRIQAKIDEFANDYDLSDLKINDMLTLRALAQAFITLEDFERYFFKLRSTESLTDTNIIFIEKINNVLSSLRRDITNLQNDLKITRRIRKGDQEESVINYIENLKQKARKFYFAKMRPVLCPECKTWIASVWSLYPQDDQSRVIIHCRRRLVDGTLCKGVVKKTIHELYKEKNEELPETID